MSLKVSTFSKNVGTAGTRVQLSTTNLYASSLIIRAKSANTGVIYVGDSTVASSNGMFLAAGESNELSGPPTKHGIPLNFNLKNIYIDSSVNGEGVIVEYVSEGSA
jgi:hypothetical protein